MKDRSEAASSNEEAKGIEGSVAEEVAALKRKLELIVTMYLKCISSLHYIYTGVNCILVVYMVQGGITYQKVCKTYILFFIQR